MNDQIETNRPRPTLRRIWAVLAGFLVIVIVTIATDLALHATGVLPPFGQPMSGAQALLALAYRLVYGVAGSYITARLAPDQPMRHALALGVVGFVVSLVGVVATWNLGPAFGPHWYSIALAITAIPCAWLGGKLHGGE